jgi:Cupin domain
MRLVVAGVNDAGRSYVESIEEITTAGPVALWDESGMPALRGILARIGPAAATEFEPPPGELRWIYMVRVPDAELPTPPYGMHFTRTLDLNIVVSGRQRCTLDEEVVDLEAGDCIVIKAANHAWDNVSDAPCAVLHLLYAPAQR